MNLQASHKPLSKTLDQQKTVVVGLSGGLILL